MYTNFLWYTSSLSLKGQTKKNCKKISQNCQQKLATMLLIPYKEHQTLRQTSKFDIPAGSFHEPNAVLAL